MARIDATICWSERLCQAGIMVMMVGRDVIVATTRVYDGVVM